MRQCSGNSCIKAELKLKVPLCAQKETNSTNCSEFFFRIGHSGILKVNFLTPIQLSSKVSVFKCLIGLAQFTSTKQWPYR